MKHVENVERHRRFGDETHRTAMCANLWSGPKLLIFEAFEEDRLNVDAKPPQLD